MKCVRVLLLLLVPVFTIAHPSGALIALDANTVIFSDSMYNSVWRLERGKKPTALVSKFHAHWTTLGLDGHVYSESFGEMGGALFRIFLDGAKPIRIAEESQVGPHVFAVGKRGELIFQKGKQIIERGADGIVKPFRGSGMVAKGDAPLQDVIAFQWAPDETLYLSDAGNLRKVGKDGVIRFIAKIDGKLLERKIWNSIDAPRIWSIAIDARKRIFAALPDIGSVVRIDADGKQHIIDQYSGGWRVTGVATHRDSVFLLESSDLNNDGQRVRVIRGEGKAESFGQVEP